LRKPLQISFSDQLWLGRAGRVNASLGRFHLREHYTTNDCYGIGAKRIFLAFSFRAVTCAAADRFAVYRVGLT
jgi:hypothetical protein